MSPVITRALLKIRVSISRNNCSSDKFSVSNGVRQGGVLSFILFTIYIDDELEKSSVGCYWNQHFVGAVCYADDITLLAPSPSALRIMLNTCTQFTTTHSLLFNASKTRLVCFSYSNFLSFNATSFSFGGQKPQLSETLRAHPLLQSFRQ